MSSLQANDAHQHRRVPPIARQALLRQRSLHLQFVSTPNLRRSADLSHRRTPHRSGSTRSLRRRDVLRRKPPPRNLPKLRNNHPSGSILNLLLIVVQRTNNHLNGNRWNQRTPLQCENIRSHLPFVSLPSRSKNPLRTVVRDHTIVHRVPRWKSLPFKRLPRLKSIPLL